MTCFYLLSAPAGTVGMCQPQTPAPTMPGESPTEGSVGSRFPVRCLCGVLNSSAEFKAEDKYLTPKASLHTDQIQFFLQPTKCQVPVCKLCHRGRRQRDAQHHGQLWVLAVSTTAGDRSFGWGKQQTTLYCEVIVVFPYPSLHNVLELQWIHGHHTSILWKALGSTETRWWRQV